MSTTSSSIKTKGSAFLNCFWDLVSDDNIKRIEAGDGIVTYLKSLDTTTPTVEAFKDITYALKRLVRGLSSSRESARLGFASCLVEVLKLNAVSIREVLDLIDENTKISNGTKRADERDMVFGRLFGFLALIRSGRLDNDFENGKEIFKTMVDLLGTKGWLREVVVEALLELLDHSSNDLIITVIVPSFHELLGDSLVDLTSSQLMLAIGK